MKSFQNLWSFLLQRFSPLALFVFILVPVLLISWRYDSLVWKSPLPDIRVKVESSETGKAVFERPYTFTVDWFAMNIPVWEKVLRSYAGKPNVRYLEIGLYKGMSALWMLENILTHETAQLTGIDPFLGDYAQRFKKNLEESGYSSKATVIEGFSQLELRHLAPESFDIIYVDGSHATKDVLADAVLSWRLLKPGGILIFDDYRWLGRSSPCEFDSVSDFPKQAIDAFGVSFQDEIEVIHNANS